MGENEAEGLREQESPAVVDGESVAVRVSVRTCSVAVWVGDAERIAEALVVRVVGPVPVRLREGEESGDRLGVPDDGEGVDDAGDGVAVEREGVGVRVGGVGTGLAVGVKVMVAVDRDRVRDREHVRVLEALDAVAVGERVSEGGWEEDRVRDTEDEMVRVWLGLRESEGAGDRERVGLRVGVRDRLRLGVWVCVAHNDGVRVRERVGERDCVGVGRVAVGWSVWLQLEGEAVGEAHFEAEGVVEAEAEVEAVTRAEQEAVVAEGVGAEAVVDGTVVAVREAVALRVALRVALCGCVRVEAVQEGLEVGLSDLGLRDGVCVGYVGLDVAEAVGVVDGVGEEGRDGVPEGERETERDGDRVGRLLVCELEGVWEADWERLRVQVLVRVTMGDGDGLLVWMGLEDGLGVLRVTVLLRPEGVKVADRVAVVVGAADWERERVHERETVDMADREAVGVGVREGLRGGERDRVWVGLHDGAVGVGVVVRVWVKTGVRVRVTVRERVQLGLAVGVLAVREALSVAVSVGVSVGRVRVAVVEREEERVEGDGDSEGLAEVVRVDRVRLRLNGDCVGVELRLGVSDRVAVRLVVYVRSHEAVTVSDAVADDGVGLRVAVPFRLMVWVSVAVAVAPGVGEAVGVGVRLTEQLLDSENDTERRVDVHVRELLRDAVPEGVSAGVSDGVKVSLQLRLQVRVSATLALRDVEATAVEVTVREPLTVVDGDRREAVSVVQVLVADGVGGETVGVREGERAVGVGLMVGLSDRLQVAVGLRDSEAVEV